MSELCRVVRGKNAVSRITTSVCLASLVLVASFLPLIAASAEDSSPNTQPQSAHRPVKITISKETTYLTGPIRSDGWLDYAAVVNERCKSGVTAENNAAILQVARISAAAGGGPLPGSTLCAPGTS
jgi:hypothetical protein